MDDDMYFEEFLHSFENRNNVDVTKDKDAYDLAILEFKEMEYLREEGFTRQELYTYMANKYGYIGDYEDNQWGIWKNG